MGTQIVIIAGPTASGKSARAVELALGGFVNPSASKGFTKPPMGEIISVDSRQVYRGLDIGTEKISAEEMQGVPHHLIDIRSPLEPYSAGDFVQDAERLIRDIQGRGKLPILAGGTHYYFDALLHGLPMGTDENAQLREELTELTTEELYTRVVVADPRRAAELDPKNRRRLVRALEIINVHGAVPARAPTVHYEAEWILIDPPSEELRTRIDARLKSAFERGLIDEVRRVREEVGDTRLNELGLEYKVVGEYLRGERAETSLMPALSAKLWQFARRQKAWLRKLRDENLIEATALLPDRN